MSRKEIDITISKENRDKGKRFRITEMSAFDAESWAMRAISGMASAGVDLPGEILRSPSVEALASIGISAFLKIERHEQEELSRQLLDCVRLIYDRKGNTRDLLPSDIEEPSTLFTLRLKALELHLSSFFAGGGSISA